MVSRIQALHVSLIDSFPLFAAAVISTINIIVKFLVKH